MRSYIVAVLPFLLAGIWTGCFSGKLSGKRASPQDAEPSSLSLINVVPDDNGGITKSEGIGISDPMPVFVMDEIRTNDVKISGSYASVFLSGTVEDAVADNLPPGYGDIASVTVFVDEAKFGTFAVTRTNGAAPSFWRQHPYRAVFGPIKVTFDTGPLVGMAHPIRVETSENQAGNTGMDSARITFVEKYAPAPPSENIFLVNEPGTSQIDTIRYYFGDRVRETDDWSFVETAASSMVFTGSLDSVEVDDPSNVVWVRSQDSMEIVNFAGLSPARVDALTVIQSHGWTSDLANVEVVKNTFTETDPTSRVFRLTYTVPPQEMVVSDIENENGRGPGAYYPFLPRAGVSINSDQWVIEFEGVQLDLVQEADGYYYPRGTPRAPIILATNYGQGGRKAFVFYDHATDTVRHIPYPREPDNRARLRAK